MLHDPLVGVTTSITVDQNPERAYVNSAYLHAVQQAGGVPVLLPPQLSKSSLDRLVRGLDALLLTGGGDMDSASFGEAPHATLYDVAPSRDALETQATLMALEKRTPLLAICRGIQVLNVALGGSRAERGTRPRALPLVIDDPEDYLPASFPHADLILALGETAGETA